MLQVCAVDISDSFNYFLLINSRELAKIAPLSRPSLQSRPSSRARPPILRVSVGLFGKLRDSAVNPLHKKAVNFTLPVLLIGTLKVVDCRFFLM